MDLVFFVFYINLKTHLLLPHKPIGYAYDNMVTTTSVDRATLFALYNLYAIPAHVES